MMYQIQATRNGVQLPTFYLDRDMQEIGETRPDFRPVSRLVIDILCDGTDCTDAVTFTLTRPYDAASAAFVYRNGRLRGAKGEEIARCADDDGTV